MSTSPAVPVVRQARSGDLPDIVLVWSSGWRDGHLGHVPDELVAERDDSYFRKTARDRCGSTWVAEDESGRITGVVILSGAELFQLAVDGTVRRSGVGAALLATAEREIFRAHESAWLAVAPGNTRAREFYARHGWVDEGPLTYQAPAAGGTVDVPVRRLVKQRSTDLTPSEG